MKTTESTIPESQVESDPDPSCIRRREFLHLLAFASLASFAAPFSFADPVVDKPKYFGAFSELSVGAVKPQGWTLQFLKRQAQGLSGHPENMAYPYDTCMLAGVIPPPSVNPASNPQPPQRQQSRRHQRRRGSRTLLRQRRPEASRLRK
jgi:hypothetical protein